MSNEWDARVYMLEFTHRWPLAILAFLVGCVLGFLISIVVPTSYTAETTLFVAYNADAIFRNPEDYKNWHMGELNALIIAPDVVHETYARLRQIDPYWLSVTTEELADSLDVQWRNTGTWRLSVKSDTAKHASQALETWIDVFLETYQEASSAAFNMLTLGNKFNNLNRKLANTKPRYLELTGVRDGMQAWMESIAAFPDDQVLDTTTRWRLKSMAARASGYNPAWGSLLKRFPSPESLPREYVAWLEEAVVYLEDAIETLGEQIAITEAELSRLDTEYQGAIDESRGLSSMVHVERATNSPPVTSSLRNPGLAALVGGLIGLMAWFVYGLVRASLIPFK